MNTKIFPSIIIIIIIIIASQRSDMVSDEQKLVLSENEVVPHWRTTTEKE